MTRAVEPMSAGRRDAYYRRQTGRPYLTDRQWRRLRHKLNRELRRAADR